MRAHPSAGRATASTASGRWRPAGLLLRARRTSAMVRRPPTASEGDDASSDRPDEPHRGPEARHLGAAQEDARLPRAGLSRELRPERLRRHGRGGGQNAGAGRRRAVLCPRGGADDPADGGGERRLPDRRRARRDPVDAGRLAPDPIARRRWRADPVGQPQPRRPRRGFRRQVQHRERRAGARGRDGRHPRRDPAHRRLSHPRGAGPRSRPAGREQAWPDDSRGRRPGRRLCRADGAAFRLRRHRRAVRRRIPHAL